MTQADTIVPDPANPQAWNRYSYGLNNPIRYSDSSGHWPDDLWSWNSSSLASSIDAIGEFVGISNLSQIQASFLDMGATFLDGGAWGIDASIVGLEAAAVSIGGTSGVVLSPGSSPITGPAGAVLGYAIVNKGTKPFLKLANRLATASTLLTYESDLLTGESTLDITISGDRSLNKAYLSVSGSLGQDTYSSLALTIAGNLAPNAPSSLPLQTLACANDVGLLRNTKAGESLTAYGRKIRQFDQGFSTIIESIGQGNTAIASFAQQKLPKSINFRIDRLALWY